MRNAFVCLVSVAALLAACSPKNDKAASNGAAAPAASAPAAVPAPASPPKPRAGLWRNTMTMAAPMAMTVKSDVCLDEAMLKGNDWMSAGKKAGGADCTADYKPGLGGFTTHSVCKVNGRTVTSDAVASGDFQSHYKVEMTSSMDPAPQGMPAQTKMSVEALWARKARPTASPAGRNRRRRQAYKADTSRPKATSRVRSTLRSEPCAPRPLSA